MAKTTPNKDQSFTRVPASMRTAAKVSQSISTKVAAKLAWNWFLTPYPFKIPKREMPMEERFGTALMLKHPKGEHFPVYQIGEGNKHLVFVHGWSGRFTQFHAILSHLEEIIPDLLQTYRITGFNAVAHRGATGKTTMMPEIGQCIAEIQKELGPIHTIISHSIGANATMYANQHLGVSLEKQVLIAPPGHISEMVRLFCLTVGFNKKVQQKIIENLKRTHGDNFDQYSAPELCKTNTTSALVFHDVDDHDTPIALGRLTGLHITSGTYIETQGLGHRRILRDSVVANEIAQFLLQ